MKKLLPYILLLLAVQAGAVVIEGNTPSGKFKTVGVTEDGRFMVMTATGVAQHVVVDTGAITAYQGGTWTVTTAIGGTGLTVTASTISATVTNQGTTTGVESVIYPADSNRKQGVFCNSTEPSVSGDIIIYFGATGIGTGTAAKLKPGDCYSPDQPSSFTGSLVGISTAPANWFYIYHR